MKKLILTIASLSLILNSFAATITAILNNGAWTSIATWDLNRTPANNDIVIIPAGKTVIINSNINAASITFAIRVYGTLTFVGGGSKLDMSASSDIHVYPGGLINSTGSPSQTIKIGGNTVYQGNQPPVAGPQFANNTTGNGFDPFATLPVKFLSFTLSHKNNDVLVQWSTSQELNSSQYEIEKSYDGINWVTIGNVTAAGNSNNQTNYSFTDKNNTRASSFYRVKEIDINGSIYFTNVLKISTSDKSGSINIYSADSKVILQFSQAVSGKVAVRIFSVSGQLVKQQELDQPVGQIILNTTFKGNYILSVSNGNDINIARQVIL